MADYRDLQVAIIGSGMGGLAAALAFSRKGFKQIHVYENAPGLGFVGAGIQIAPNLIRVLDHLGIWAGSSVQSEATNVQQVGIYDGPTNKPLTLVSMADISDRFGYQHYAGHRASLAGGIFDAAKAEPNIHFHFGHTLEDVVSYEPGAVSFIVKDQEGKSHTVKTDVLIGADGIKSAVRYSMMRSLNIEAEVVDTGTACYRILLKREQLEPYPELLELIDSDNVRRWIGEKRHIIAYPIHNHTIYNIATAQPDVNFAGPVNSTWTTLGDKKAMMAVYADFNPVIQKLLDLVPAGDVVEWRLRSHTPLETWTKGSVALLGDACHPTLPHLSQGAAMAIEDAAALAEVVSRVPGGGADPQAVANALKAYELLRKDRTTTLVELAALSGRTLHLGDGKAKEERDRQFAEAQASGQENGTKKPVPDKWASPEVQDMIFKYDVIKDAQDRFHELYDTVTKGGRTKL